MMKSRTSSWIALIFLSVSTLLLGIEGYMNNRGLPPMKQKQWLSQLTGDICESPPGSQLINGAPQVMKGWSTSKKVTAENAVSVELLVKRLVDESKAGNQNAKKPTTEDYNVMLSLWERSRGGVFAAERSEQILTTMQQLYSESGDETVQPDVNSFKSVLLAWKNSGVSFQTHRAQRVLEWMVRLYNDGENDLCLPDSECFDIVMQVWSRNSSRDPQAAEKAEQLLIFQQKLAEATQSPMLQPTTYSFNAVLNALGKKFAKDPTDDMTKLCNVLDLMEHLHQVDGDKRVEPDRCSYNIVLFALAKGASATTASKADSILRSIEQQYKAGALNWEPETVLFNAVIGSWARSDTTGAYRKARSVLDRQLYLYNEHDCHDCKPDVIGFTSVLSSCASEPKRQERLKAFHVALATFQHLEKNIEEFGSPNHVTYGTMLKACARLLPNDSAERKKWTRTFFKKCIASGMVGGMVLSRVREAAFSKEEYAKLMKGHSKNSLPESWTCNVHEKSEYRQNPRRLQQTK
eukprot:scaffold1469_cov119-Cylindrotheca_fusiformis.AAC.17